MFAIVSGFLSFVCGLGGAAGYFLWTCPTIRKLKHFEDFAVRQLKIQEEDGELVLSLPEQEGAEDSCSELVKPENNNELVYQDRFYYDTYLEVSSGEEEDVQTQLLSAGRVSSRESVRTAVSERGYRRQGRRNRFVPTNCPTVGYFTDSTSLSGAGTDVSANDASDEDSNEEDFQGQLSSASSVTMMVQEEATKVNTPPLFAQLHRTTVYDHRPGVATEPRQPADGI